MKVEKEYYTITVFGQIVVLKSFYAWDARENRQLTADMHRIIETLFPDGLWALLCDVRSWELNTPDAEKDSRQNMENPDLLFPSHVVFVTGQSQMKHWQLERMVKDHERFKFAIFQHMADAVNWLANKGYQFPSTDILTLCSSDQPENN